MIAIRRRCCACTGFSSCCFTAAAHLATRVGVGAAIAAVWVVVGYLVMHLRLAGGARPGRRIAAMAATARGELLWAPSEEASSARR